MNEDLLTQTAIVAQTYSDSRAFNADTFRFKNCEELDKSDLFTLRNNDLIEQVDDPWSETTWRWTESGSNALLMVESSIIDEATEAHLTALERQGTTLMKLPRTETFLANQFGLLGEQLKTLSTSDLIEKSDTQGQLTVWSVSNFGLRLLTSLESAAHQVASGNQNNAVVADD